MNIEQVLQLVRALFAAQIDREPNDLREWLLRQIAAALTIEAQGDPVRAALDAAIRSDNEATSQRAQRALLALDALVALDALIADRDAEAALSLIQYARRADLNAEGGSR